MDGFIHSVLAVISMLNEERDRVVAENARDRPELKIKIDDDFVVVLVDNSLKKIN